MIAQRIRGCYEILEVGEVNGEVYYKILQNIDERSNGDIVFVKEKVLERSEIQQ